ncbi:putative secondary metabolism biosynthetic enzyme [Podospora bellae-mahoneyi]|uniref:Secondary metabolism biosynthetic enzyme n=1 Tax=Podospora bellae-mahoneyi TaxID=2093777 RepID=A0ABR0FY30_9PEZI|nr:putative secondary metabolism biosynthetic enzyme [Podospora bellae-mahoneyi]
MATLYKSPHARTFISSCLRLHPVHLRKPLNCISDFQASFPYHSPTRRDLSTLSTMSAISNLPKTFRAAVLTGLNQPLELQSLPLIPPGPGQILVKVLACGICHTDAFVAAGIIPTSFPRILGHEIIGEVAALGEGVKGFSLGERVGGGWHGGHDGTCPSCVKGAHQYCANEAINGVSMNGGYAEYCLLRHEAVSRIPLDADPASTAPFLCAGTTVFNALRHSGIIPGEEAVVAVQGVGGLGHLAVQYSKAMGYKTIGVSTGSDKKDLVMGELGADGYIDSLVEDPVERLQEMGGAKVIVSTAPSAKAIGGLLGGLANFGRMVVLAPVGGVEFDTFLMVTKAVSVSGWSTGTAVDGEEAVAFAKRNGVRCFVERFGLDRVNEAFEGMKGGKPRFRNVLVME